MFVRVTTSDNNEVIVNLDHVKQIRVDKENSALIFASDLTLRITKESCEEIQRVLFPPPGKFMVS
jgi:hypothetical protein